MPVNLVTLECVSRDWTFFLQKLFPWIASIAALILSSAFASVITDQVAPGELYGFVRVCFSFIPGAFVSWIHDSSRRRKRNVHKHILSGLGAMILVAVQRDALHIPLTLSLEFALAGTGGFVGGEVVFGWNAKRSGLKGGDENDSSNPT